MMISLSNFFIYPISCNIVAVFAALGRNQRDGSAQVLVTPGRDFFTLIKYALLIIWSLILAARDKKVKPDG